MTTDQASEPSVFSVGHSNHELDVFLGLLQRAGIEAVADVRSVPRSGYSPQFDRAPLERALAEVGTRYVFLGAELGGRPEEPEYYDADDHVRYDLVARSEQFEHGLARLLEGARRYRVAMLCSEENPEHCHRRLLVARVLAERGVGVEHLRGDGTIASEAELGPLDEPRVQGSLFEGGERTTWRSVRPVSRDGRPRSSSVA